MPGRRSTPGDHDQATLCRLVGYVGGASRRMGRTWRRVALQGGLDLRYSMAVGVVHGSWVEDERCAELSKGCPTSKSSVLSYEVASNVSTDTVDTGDR